MEPWGKQKKVDPSIREHNFHDKNDTRYCSWLARFFWGIFWLTFFSLFWRPRATFVHTSLLIWSWWFSAIPDYADTTKENKSKCSACVDVRKTKVQLLGTQSKYTVFTHQASQTRTQSTVPLCTHLIVHPEQRFRPSYLHSETHVPTPNYAQSSRLRVRMPFRATIPSETGMIQWSNGFFLYLCQCLE